MKTKKMSEKLTSFKALVLVISLVLVLGTFVWAENKDNKKDNTKTTASEPNTNKPTSDSNGCGTGWNKYLVKDKPGGFNFTKPCNKHDDCYSTPGQSKKQCDNQFKQDMHNVCNKETDKDKKKKCEKHENRYYRWVDKHGKKAYDKAQKKAKKKTKKNNNSGQQ